MVMPRSPATPHGTLPSTPSVLTGAPTSADVTRFLDHLDDRQCRVFVGLLVQHLSTRQTRYPTAAVEQLARFALSAPGPSAMTEQLLPTDHAYLTDRFVAGRLEWPSHLDPAGRTFLSRIARRRDETVPNVEHCLH